MPARLLLAPDKFRGTADQVALIDGATARGAELGWQVIGCPLSDGGEGLLDVFGGTAQLTTVTGPLGTPVEAEWRLFVDEHHRSTAVIETARASGLVLVGTPADNDPLGATTVGTGELIRSAIEKGATRIFVGCGGSATTDGGLGAIRAIGDLLPNPNIALLAVSDVTTLFTDNPRVFGPQKGATPTQVDLLSKRLEDLGVFYRERYGIDVTAVKGAGAAGGLAGGLAALGATVVAGFDLVAEHVGLSELIDNVDLVITGEGRLDGTSVSGKVVGELARRCANKVPLLIICGEMVENFPTEQLQDASVVSLSERFGQSASMNETLSLFAQVVGEELARRAP